MYTYVIKLEQNKYYIGKTNNPSIRLEEHKNHTGSKWTQKYPPLEILEIIKDIDEDTKTLEYMNKFGIDNVRGGSFCQIILHEDEVKVIEKMLQSKSNKCFGCGKVGHFIGDCPNKINKKNNIKLNKCLRCGRLNHQTKNCFANTNVDGTQIIFCLRCGRYGHELKNCYAKTHINGNSLDGDNGCINM